MIIKQQYPSSSSSKVYTAQFDPSTGKSSCDCQGWTMKRGDKPRSCKHTKDLESRQIGGVPLTVLAPVTTAKVVKFPTPSPSHSPFDEVQGEAPVSKAPAIKPMLASAMKEDQSLADFTGPEWVMEEKFDGHRLSIVVTAERAVSGWSRPGGDRPSAERALPEGLVNELKQLPQGIYDGELYIPWVSEGKPGTSSDVVRLDLKDKLKMVLFDVVEQLGVAVTEKPLTYRRELLKLAVAHISGAARVAVAEQQPVSVKAVQAIWDNRGEGAIIKRIDSTYKSGWRTPNWIKVKAIAAAQLTITGFEAGKNGPNSVFKLKHDDGRETTVKVLTNELLAQVHANPAKYIGRRVTISYMGLTTSGTWRHPIFDHFVDGGN